MNTAPLSWHALSIPGFGARGEIDAPAGQRLSTLLNHLSDLPEALYRNDGLLVIGGLSEITDQPSKLVTLSQVFGTEVEDYRQSLLDPDLGTPRGAGDLDRVQRAAG